MEKYYAKDLDELIIFRLKEFKTERLPFFSTDDIEMWNRFNEDILILPFDENYPLRTVQQEKLFDKVENHDIDFRVIYDEILIDSTPYLLMSRMPMIEKLDLMRTLSFQYGILLCVVLISLSAIFYQMSKILWRPFHSTLSKVRDFSLEKEELPQFEETNTTEFAQLNSILDDFISDNVNSYQKQKEFIENLSHELQTPITVIKSQLDMLLQQPGFSKEQMDIIQSLYSISSKMTRMNKNLLLLIRINNDQYADMEEVDFVKSLQAQLLYLQERAESDGIKVNVEIKNPLSICANRMLVESLLTNLIVNAIRHNTKNGVINMKVVGSDFIISNTGITQALDEDDMFSRFNRASKEKKGNGLGLYIVYEICKMHNWKIQYNYKENLHTFTVRFAED